MEFNVGSVDAAVRASLAVLFLIAAAILNSLPVTSLFLAIVALALFGTALTRTCPLYRLLGVSTSRKGDGGAPQPRS